MLSTVDMYLFILFIIYFLAKMGFISQCALPLAKYESTIF